MSDWENHPSERPPQLKAFEQFENPKGRITAKWKLWKWKPGKSPLARFLDWLKGMKPES